MLQKRMFKVMTKVEKKGGGSYWMRLGSAYENKDASFNLYLDAMPKNFELHMRELDEEDLRKRESNRSGPPSLFAAPAGTNPASTSTDAVPF